MKAGKIFAGGILGAALLLSAAPRVAAQEVDLEELIRQVRRNMVQVEKEMDKAEAQGAKAAGSEAKKNLDELIRNMKTRGKQVADDIEEIVKNIPL